MATREKAARLADEGDAPVYKPYLITVLSKTKEAAMDVRSLYEDVKPIGFQEFLIFDLKSAFKITQLGESGRAIRRIIMQHCYICKGLNNPVNSPKIHSIDARNPLIILLAIGPCLFEYAAVISWSSLKILSAYNFRHVG